MSKKRAFARYTKKGQLVPGSLVVTTNGGYPDKTSLWKEVPVWFNDETSQNYGAWRVVTGGIAGDGTVLSDNTGNSNRFTIIGPDDDEDNGWVYLKQYFPDGALLSIDYDWASFDEGTGVDRPVYWTSSTEPTGIPGDTDPRVSATPENGTWEILVTPGQWFAVGVYSTDSCCGRGFLAVEIEATPVFSDTIYWGEDSLTACGQFNPITVTGDGTTFCNSNNFTGSAIASIGSGSAFFAYADEVKTVNVTSGSDVATFNGGCDPCLF